MKHKERLEREETAANLMQQGLRLIQKSVKETETPKSGANRKFALVF